MKIELIGFGRNCSINDAKGNATEEREVVQYRRGDPEFDSYVTTVKEKQKLKQTQLPKNLMLPPNGNSVEMMKRIGTVFSHYYTGQVGEQAVKDTMSEVVSELRSTYLELGFDEASFMPKLIEDVYDDFRLTSISKACEASWMDSRNLAAMYNGHTGNTRDTIYYDSKYYYSTESMKQTLVETGKKLGAQYGITDLELPTSYQDHDIRKGIYSSYNTYINFNARTDSKHGNMLDENMVPPENFRFFFKGNDGGKNKYSGSLSDPTGDPYAFFDGVLHVWHDDWSFTGRVPTRSDANQFPISVNMFDVVSKSTSIIPDSIVGFLKNFDFFTTIQSGTYLNTHPRVL